MSLVTLTGADVKIFWHPQGDYLAVKVDRFTKTKKSTYTGFELFSIREKDIPMDVSATLCCCCSCSRCCYQPFVPLCLLMSAESQIVCAQQ